MKLDVLKVSPRIFLMFLCSFVYLLNVDLAYSTVKIESSSDFYRDAEFFEFKGLPRLGVLDTSGFLKPGEHMMTAQRKIREDKENADRVGYMIEKHNYSLALLMNLDFMRNYPDCFENLKGYQVRTEGCSEVLIDHHAQTNLWNKYIEILAYSMVPAEHEDQFCFGREKCTVKAVDMLAKMDNGRMQRLDEFDKRELVSNLMNKHHDSFENYWKSMKFPEEAYMVQAIQIGDYNFNQQRFSFRFSHTSSLASRNFLTGPLVNTLNARNMPSQVKYVPTLAFEKMGNNTGSSYISPFTIEFPLPMGEAKAMVQGKNKYRYYYAVARVKFLEREMDAYLPEKNMSLLSYHYAENRIELYEDEALTKKVADLVINPKAASQGGSDSDAASQANSKYKLPADAYIFDHRVISLLRFAAKEVSKESIYQMAYSIASTERMFWRDYQQRVDAANREIPAAQNAVQQKRNQDNKKMYEDRAKLSNVSWQSSAGLTSGQKKAMFDIMLGYDHLKDGYLQWPKGLPSVTWGLNLITVFDRDKLPKQQMDQYSPVDEATQKTVQSFLSEIAQSQKLDKLSLVYRLDDVSYDQAKGVLMLSKKKWPLYSPLAVTFYEGGLPVLQSNQGGLVSAKAKDRKLYVFHASNATLGQASMDGIRSMCTNNQKKKSRDCTINHTAFMNVYFHNMILALDKEIQVNEIPVTDEVGMEVAKSYRGTGIRLIVELRDPQMEIMDYKIMDQRSKKEMQKEAQTVLANVQRVLIVDKDDMILWSQGEQDMPQVKVPTSEVKNTTPKAPAVQMKKVEAAPQANNDLARQQCIQKVQAEKKQYDACQKMKAEVQELEEQVKADCSPPESIPTGSSLSEIEGPCKVHEGVDLVAVGQLMQSCIQEECGQPTLGSIQGGEYQSCIMKVQTQMKAVMTQVTGAAQQHAISNQKCEAVKQNLDMKENKMKMAGCDKFKEAPSLDTCK